MPKVIKRSKKRTKKSPSTEGSMLTTETTETNESSPSEVAPMEASTQASARDTSFGAKARFIRSQPFHEPARKVVERAKQVGLKISGNHVYATRQRMKDSEQEGAVEGASNGKRTAITVVASASKQKLLEQLEALIFRIGYDDAESVFLRMKRDHHI